MTSERRRSPRVRAPEGAEGLIRSTTQVHVEDLSRTGVRFQLSAPVRPGSTYGFHADIEGFILTVPIRITRCKADYPAKGAAEEPGLVYQAGAEFLWGSAEDEEKLASWLAQRGPASGPIQAKLRG